MPLLCAIAAPDPDERVGQRLLEDTLIAVAGALGEDEALRITLRFERGGSAFAGHHPIVISLLRILCAQVVFGNMRENPQRFLLTGFDEFRRSGIPPAPGKFRLLGASSSC